MIARLLVPGIHCDYRGRSQGIEWTRAKAVHNHLRCLLGDLFRYVVGSGPMDLSNAHALPNNY